MGKRKRNAGPNKALSSDLLQHSSQMESLPQQESSPQVESHAVTPISSILELADDSLNLPKSSQLPVHQHRLSRTMFLRNPSLYTRKYSRRNVGGHADSSTSHAKVIPLHDEKAIPKTGKESHKNDAEQQSENLASETSRPERSRQSPLSADAPSYDMEKICRICDRLLKKKPDPNGNSSEPSVVAVLVCGHVYHADCLEQRTGQEERTDPSCPLCSKD